VTEVVFVGTSDAFGAGGRRHTALLVRGAAGSALLDCGPTTVSGLEALQIPRDSIDAIALSHFHGDHFGGIPSFLLGCLYEDGREQPLLIAGPAGVEERVRKLCDVFGFSIEGREWNFPIEFIELPAGHERNLGPIRVRSFEAHHQKEVVPHGLAVHCGEHRIVFTGDTGWFDQLPQEVGEADLFICECTYYDRDFEFHLNYQQLLERRDQFRCRRMVITHLGREMQALRGNCEFETADDGLVIRL